MIIKNKSFNKRILPLGVIQTLGVFNGNEFKSVVIFIALGFSKDYSGNYLFIAVITVVFVALFFICPIPSGYLADKYSKWNVMAIGCYFGGRLSRNNLKLVWNLLVLLA